MDCRVKPGNDDDEEGSISITLRYTFLVLLRVLRFVSGGGAGEVELEQLRERVFLGNVGRPAIGSSDRGVEVAVGVNKPLRALVVEIGQRALAQSRFAAFAIAIARGSSA
jgi:hypothetical protein